MRNCRRCIRQFTAQPNLVWTVSGRIHLRSCQGLDQSRYLAPSKSLINNGIAALVVVSKPICRRKYRNSHQRNSRSYGAVAVHFFQSAPALRCSRRLRLKPRARYQSHHCKSGCPQNNGRNSLPMSRRRQSKNRAGVLQETSGFCGLFR